MCLCIFGVWHFIGSDKWCRLFYNKRLEFFAVNLWIYVSHVYSFWNIKMLIFEYPRFNHEDLQPNIGLFWYFFTEMFEHFRILFLYTFQMNATILYLLPLTIKLHKQPLLLATVLQALISIFRSYPCVGDVAFYMALFPLWKRSAKCKLILISL